VKCINCQSELPNDAKYCPKCGQKVTVFDKSAKRDTHNKINKDKSFKNPLHALGLIIAAITVAIIIVMLILDSNQKTKEEKESISTNALEIPEEVQVKLEKLAKNPDSIALNIEMGNILFDINRFGEAIPFYQKALSLDASNIGVQIDLAVCFFNLRNFDQAIVEMEKALEIDPIHPKGLFNMGIIYYNLNKPEDVRKYWNKLKVNHPQSMETKRAEELLQNLQ